MTQLVIETATEESVRSGELGRRLRAFNYEHVGEYPPQAWVRLDLKDDEGRMHGGLRGFVFVYWLRVEVLFVEQALRGQGWGAKLLAEAERRGIALGARQAGVETFDWQAPGFYLRQGYAEASVVPDYIDGHSLHFFRKRLETA